MGNNDLITPYFLMLMHPELSSAEACELMAFCSKHTINHVECYGDGSIMYPKYKESKA